MCSFTIPAFSLSKYWIGKTNCLKFPLTLVPCCLSSWIQPIRLRGRFHFTNPDLVLEIPTWSNTHDFDSGFGSGPIKKDLHYTHQIMIIAFSPLAASEAVRENDNFQCSQWLKVHQNDDRLLSFHCSRWHIPQVSYDIQRLGTLAHWYNSFHLCVSFLNERKIRHNLKNDTRVGLWQWRE